MKSSRQVERIVGQARLAADPATDQRILSDAGAALAKNADNRPQASQPGPTIWRTIMGNRITRYSVAAVVALAAALVLLNPLGTTSTGVALAQVQARVAGIETMIIRGTKTFTLPSRDGEVFEFGGIKGHFDLVKYFSAQQGLVEEGYADGELIYRFTFNRPQRQTLLLLPRYKKYGKFPSTDEQMRLLESGTPKGIVNLLTEGGYKELGRDHINGLETEVLAFEDPRTFKDLLPKAIADLQSIKGKVWIAIDEQLPVRVEGDIAFGRGFMTMFHEVNLHEVNTFGDYNVELDDAIFDTTAPEGYTELTLSDILQAIPAKAKAAAAGLGIVPAGFVFWMRRRRKAPIHPGNLHPHQPGSPPACVRARRGLNGADNEVTPAP